MRRGRRPAPTVFLDRDGTINREVEYLSRPEQLELIEGAAKAVRMLNHAGFRIVVVTNQSGVARGLFDENQVRIVNDVLAHMLEQHGAMVDDWYYCPHHPDAGSPPYRQECTCRKPGGGMVKQADRDFPVDFANSFVVGDTMSDMELGLNCGMRSVLVLTGHGKKTLSQADKESISRVSFIADDLLQAARWICSKQDNEP